ncbi:hypothetical protein AB6D53_17185 [Vibrio splendidus]
MFDNLIFVIKVTSIVATLFMVGYFLWDGHFWAAGAMFVTLLSFIYWIINGWDVDLGVLSTLATVITALTAAHYFTTSDATDLELQRINRQLFNEFSVLNYCPEVSQPDKMKRVAFKKLKKIASIKCLMQTNDDMLCLSIDLAKAAHLPTSVGFGDTVYSEFFDTTKVIKCVDLARAADKLCPNLLRTKIPPRLL